MDVAAGIAGAFHMDPCDVWKGSDYDVAFRLAAERRLAVMTTEAITKAAKGG